MSQYNVERWPDSSYSDVRAACQIMWAQQPFPSKHHKCFLDYFQAVLNDGAEELPSIVCSLAGHFKGGLSIGHLTSDSHFPGKGIIVYNTVVDQAHPEVTRLLYRSLIQKLKAEGGSWYQTTRRVSETEFSFKFRRIHNGGT